MWLVLAFASAILLGFYDVSKKKALTENMVIPVLFWNTFFSSLIFLPFVIFSKFGMIPVSSAFYVHDYGWTEHAYIFAKSVLVLSSWLFAYWGLKHLPITIVGPINATRPIWVLLGALTFFGEKPSMFQWLGIALAIVSFYMLSNTGKKEGINFKKNKWILFVVVANIIGAFCGLYDKYLLATPENRGISLNVVTLLSWYNIYQLILMSAVMIVSGKTKIKWRWSVLLISVFLSCAELFYFSSLALEGAMISIVSMIRRSSVVVSFLLGAWLFKEKNIKNKFFDLILILVSMVFLCM